MENSEIRKILLELTHPSRFGNNVTGLVRAFFSIVQVSCNVIR